MPAVNFLHYENLSNWAGVEPATIGGEGQRQTNETTQQINLEVNSADVPELLDSHYQELTIDELTEMHEQDIEELESFDPVQSEDRMIVGNLTEGLNLIEKRVFSIKIGVELSQIALSPVWCSKLWITTGVYVAFCHDEFRGPLSGVTVNR
ncbi:hypothetical protein TNCV_2669971 [Trichonephila clavipes]|nr:hypothetical protein TNCV_2669971 [Trichonephila clavipes]